ncbi:hypothetical protein ACVH9Z_38140 [Rhodococcus opacus]|uniref:hypothetical protein n=1 Tax=Rhodococcus opacus TaxID=37919 RepID=UPI000B02E995|nr:hypothetical protein [Rhodococcus opacus]MDJ0420785.1 hypothetical protein [Rhodococcus opacus]MDV7089018.1 hypothetical protein [Rhodococcus opacus]UNN04572.1 hypothetical protein MOO23_36655 [Rhodococcus opacus]WKN52616.1 hypothetical protein HJ581_0001475 [Rhodococcus opacus]
MTADTTTSLDVLDEAGRAKTQQLLKTLADVERKRETGGYSIDPGSDLALDHERMTGLLVSHSVDRALHHSLDCLWGLDRLLVVNGPQHYAPYVLIRGALESAATAVWLLDSDERTTRLQRRVALDIDNSKERSNAIKAAGRAAEDDAEQHKSGLSTLLRDADLTLRNCQWKGYTAVVQEIDDAPNTMGSVELAWRACSGMSHGKFWSFQVFAAETSRRTLDSTSFQADFSPSYHGLSKVLDVAVRTIHRADALYEKRRKADQ